MGLFDPDAWPWANLAHALGFTPRTVVGGFGEEASFRQLVRTMGPRALPPPSYAHWLHGTRAGAEGIVVHYSTGSGSSRSYYTAACVRIDPPILLGISIRAEGFLSTLFGGEDVILGIPQIDQALRLGAHQPARLRELLVPHHPQDMSLLSALADATRDGVYVTDSTVVARHSGLCTEIGPMERALDRAAWIASALSARRRRMGDTREEQAVKEQWRLFASSERLDFDPACMVVTGVVNGCPVELGFETNQGRIHTAVTVRWPHTLGVGLHVRKAGALSFLTSLFEQDISTGDGAFDDAFVVQGHPEEAVRRLLASNVALRGHLRDLASRYWDVTMNDTGVFWIVPMPLTDAAQLHHQLHQAVSVSRALFGAVAGAGPYR